MTNPKLSPYAKNIDENISTDTFKKNASETDVFSTLRNIRLKNINRIIFATLNINSISGKFDQLKCIITGNIDVLVITETKLDDSFPTNQFNLEGFSTPYRQDRNRFGGGILIYIREGIPNKLLSKHTFSNDIEGIFVEINMRKIKWLLLGSYHPPSQSDQYYFENLSKALDIYTEHYEKFILPGDFNAEDKEPILNEFLYQYDAKNIVKDKICFKSIENPSCIDLIITNSRNSFQNTTVISTGLSDFHKMALTVLKTKFEKAKPKEIKYRDYKRFDNILFKEDLRENLLKGCDDYKKFENIFLTVLEKHAPSKKKKIRANHAPYMTKALRKKSYLSPYLCGYRKGYSTEHALVSLIEKWKVSRDKEGYTGAILMDLSKAFDTLNHDLLVAKLHAYGFSHSAFTLIKD